MGQPQQEARWAAAEAFKQSLEQLQQSLESTQESPKSQPPSLHSPKPTTDRSAKFDLNIWEDAIADIERFIQQRQAGQG